MRTLKRAIELLESTTRAWRGEVHLKKVGNLAIAAVPFGNSGRVYIKFKRV